MQGARTLSIFVCALAFQIFLVAAIADLPELGAECGSPRRTLAEKLGAQDMPELFEVFGLPDAPPRPPAELYPAFGCIQY